MQHVLIAAYSQDLEDAWTIYRLIAALFKLVIGIVEPICSKGQQTLTAMLKCFLIEVQMIFDCAKLLSCPMCYISLLCSSSTNAGTHLICEFKAEKY